MCSIMACRTRHCLSSASSMMAGSSDCRQHPQPTPTPAPTISALCRTTSNSSSSACAHGVHAGSASARAALKRNQ